MTAHFTAPRNSLLAVSTLLAALAGCNEQPTAEDCVADVFTAQAHARFVAGQTYWLPVLDDSSACADLRWTVAERPEGSLDPIVKGADGIWRITPTTTGTYRFELAGTSDSGSAGEVTLEVVDANAKPFENLNYYPSGSLAQVGDELWVANVQQPTITRIDPSTMTVLGEIAVGPWPVSLAWREGMDFALVAQRGSDTLGVVALADDAGPARLVDAIWIGDEPAHVAVSADGKRAYASLQSEGAVAVIDLDKRTRAARIDVVRDPRAMALSEDGKTLWVASHRSGHPDRYPYEADPIEDERDVAVIDTEAGEVVDWWLDLGTTITALTLGPDGSELYVSRLLNDTAANLADPEGLSFVHELAVLDAATGELLRSADLGRQASSGGPVVSLHGISVGPDRVWVVAEGSDLALALDPTTLAEQARVAAPGRPRSLVRIADELFVHGSQQTTLTRVAADAGSSATTDSLTTTSDPRPELVADGQAYFTGAGRDYAVTWSCNSCHADGLSDTLIWNAGPFSGRKVSRPFFWLEGTWPLGWDGYLSSIDNYAFTVNTNVGVRPTTAEHRALSAYLASLMPPPAANGYTRRDGTLSELGAVGKQVFEDEAGCASCHPLPMTSNRALLAAGVSEGPTDVPALIGSYRLGAWTKLGGATSLSEAVDLVSTAFGGGGLASERRSALDQFLLELTARDFIVLTSDPRPNTASVATDQPLVLTFSAPVWDDPTNLEGAWLRGPEGAVEVTRELSADGRHLSLVPLAPLAHATEYTLVVEPTLAAFDERTPWTADPSQPSAWETTITTGAAPTLRLAGDYLWTIDMPTADIEAGEFDLENTIPTVVTMTIGETGSGGAMLLDYGQDLTLERVAVVDGSTFVTPPLPIPIGPSFADSSGAQGMLIDLDDDGIGDEAEGTLTISGPGFQESGVHWKLSRPSAAGECNEGSEGALPIDLSFDGEGLPLVDWGAELGLGVYFIDPDAQPPAGPGQPVTGGDVYWAVQLENFPDGFAGPVTYGVVPPAAIDTTADVGGGDGPAELVAGQCYKVVVLTTGFVQGSVVFAMP
ncbi:Ig-like domain-containing protein [Nannocystaceae bacterium ST9]